MMQKKIKPWIILFFIFLLPLPLYSDYEKYVHEIARSFAREMKEELGLVCNGDSGMMHEQIEEIGFQFLAFRRATIEEARALQLHVMNKLVQAINNHPKIQPYLEVRPFTYRRVSISIAFEGSNGLYSDGSVYHVFNVPETATVESNRNRIFYNAHDPFADVPVDCTLLSESYTEAEQLVKSSTRQNLLVHETTAQEAAIDQLFETLTDKLWEECGLRRWCIGGKLTQGIEEIGATFMAIYPADLEKARRLQVVVAEKLLTALNSHEILRPSLKEVPFSANRLKIRICFRTNRYWSYKPGQSLEDVVLENNEVVYSHRVPICDEKGDCYTDVVEVLTREPYFKAKETAQSHLLKDQEKSKVKRELQQLWV